MRSLVFLLLFFAAAVVASCEDKHSSTQNEAEKMLKEPIQPDSASIDNTKVEKNVDAETDRQKREGPLIVQEELIPFYNQYAEETKANKVRIKTRFGDIDVELFKDTPLHRGNFLFLVKNDYFDDTFFHRVAKGFVIQGGNSDTPETNIKRHHIGDFLIPNEAEAGHTHVRGALSASKYIEQNVSQASSPYEFFIVQSKEGAHHLDGEHTVFGRVIKGMDVVDSIANVPVDGREWPLQNIYIDAEIIE